MRRIGWLITGSGSSGRVWAMRWTRIALVSVLLGTMLLATVSEAAAAKPVKGNWIVTLETPMGRVPLHVTFGGAKGKITVTSPKGSVPGSYRQAGNNLSFAFEGPGFAPDGSSLTFVVRATLTDHEMTGTAHAITDTVDANSPVGLHVVRSPVLGHRAK
jgi:hypothetical protein